MDHSKVYLTSSFIFLRYHDFNQDPVQVGGCSIKNPPINPRCHLQVKSEME